MNRLRLPTIFAGAATVLTLGVTHADAATTALAGQVNQFAFVSLGPNSNGIDADLEPQQNGLPGRLHASVHAVATAGDATLSGDSKLTATWASANKGSVVVTGHGWTAGSDTDQAVNEQMDFSDPNAPLPDWAYAFGVDHDGTFALSAEIIGAGDLDTEGLGNWSVGFIEDNQPVEITPLHKFLEPDTDDTSLFTHDLAAGHTFIVEIFNNEHDEETDVLPFRAGHEQANFNWTISGEDGAGGGLGGEGFGGGVPEPSTWALSLLGFGVAGAALRRRTRLAVLA